MPEAPPVTTTRLLICVSRPPIRWAIIARVTAGGKTVTDPAELTAVDARGLIGARELSPVELLEACLKAQ